MFLLSLISMKYWNFSQLFDDAVRVVFVLVLPSCG